jgi:hypothetical protein
MLAALTPRHLLSVAAGILIGLGLGLLVTWGLWPVEYYDTDPVDLRREHKDDYVVMIAAAYAQDRDLDTASARLETLGLGDATEVVLGLFQRYDEAGYKEETHSLARLAYDLGVTDVALLPYIQEPTPTPAPTATPEPSPTEGAAPPPTVTPTEAAPEPTSTPTEPPPSPTVTSTPVPPTATATATATPEDTPTPLPPGDFDYQLVEQRDLGCSAERDGDYILVYVRDENERGLGGVEILVKGGGIEDSFFTGLKPEVDPGFADFLVTDAGSYSVEVVAGKSHVAQGLSFADDCPAASPHRSWRVVFRRVAE